MLFCKLNLIVCIKYHADISHRGIVDATVNEKQLSSNNAYLKSSADTEKLINDVLKVFLSPSSYSLIRRSHKNKNLSSQENMLLSTPKIGDAICHEMVLLLKKWNIRVDDNLKKNLFNSYDSSLRINPRNAVYHELFSFPYKLMKIGDIILKKFGNFYQKKNYQKKGYQKSNFKLEYIKNKKSNNLESVESIDHFQMYIKSLSECMKSDRKHFNIKKAAGDLLKNSPTKLSKIAQRRFKRNIPRNNYANNTLNHSEFEASICHLLVNNTSVKNFQSCLTETERIDDCIKRKFMEARYSDNSMLRTSKKVLGLINKLDSGCQVKNSNENTNIVCVKKSNTSFVYNEMNKFTPKSPIVKEYAKSLYNYFDKGQRSSRILHEIGSLIHVYNKGFTEKNRLLKMSKYKSNVLKKYKTHEKSLNNYRNNLLDVSLRSAINLHSAAMTVEKSLIDSAAELPGNNLTEYSVTMKCIVPLLTTVFGEQSQPYTQNYSYDDNQAVDNFWNQHSQRKSHGNFTFIYSILDLHDSLIGSFFFSIYFSIGNLSKMYVYPLKNLTDSLKRITQTRMMRKTSTISKLANTFLLATMFYECMSILAVAMYRPETIGSIETPTV